MQVRPSPRHLAGKVNFYTTACANNPDQRPLGEGFPAADAGALGHMLDTLDRFLGHTGTCFILPSQTRRRVYASSWSEAHRGRDHR